MNALPRVAMYDDNRSLARGFEDVAEWTMATKLPGGCHTLECVVYGDENDRFEQQEETTIAYAEVSAPSAEVIWSGELQSITWDETKSSLVFAGWWQSLAEVLFAFNADRYPTPTTVSAILRDLVAQASGRLDPSTRAIRENPVDVAAASGQSLTQLDNRSSLDVLVDLLDVAGAANEPWTAAVWPVEDPATGRWTNRLHYGPEAAEPTWRLRRDMLLPGYSFTRDESQLYSTVIVTYADPDGNAQVHHQQRLDTVRRLRGFDRAYPLNLTGGLRYPLEAVKRLADLFLELHAYAIHRPNNLIAVADELPLYGGGTEDAYLLRAGDVVEIVDLPTSQLGTTNRLDGLRRFLVTTTSFRSTDRRATFTLDNAPRDLVSTLAKLLGQKPPKAAA